MLSTKHDAALLTYFLLEIRRAGATALSVVVTNYSRALLVALVCVFSDCADLKHYLQCCYDITVKNKETVMPASYLRLDVSHIIRIVSNWECLRNLPNKVRQFYLRCISQAYKMQSLKELHSLLFSLLVVALSEDTGHMDNKNLVPTKTCLQSFNDCIKDQYSAEQLKIEDEILLDDFDSEETPSSWQMWSNDIYSKAHNLALKSQNGQCFL